MSNQEQELEQVELSIKHARKNIDRHDSFNKMMKTKEFKSLIEDGYFVNEASRLVLLKADPSLQSDEDQKQLDNSIMAIGHLRQYFMTIVQLGSMSAKALVEDLATHNEILGEE